MNYTRDHFIAKFEAIPEDKWVKGFYTDGQGNCCALGHCGMKAASYEDAPVESSTNESRALSRLLLVHDLSIIDINDGQCAAFRQDTPKQRVLAALRSLPA